MTKEEIRDLETYAKELRVKVLRMIYKAQAAHIASSYSILDILLYLYDFILKIDPGNPQARNRDKLILSKGWAAAALYSVLARKGFFPEALLEQYCFDGSPFLGISTLSGVPGVEATTGSMGHGLPIGNGMALANKMDSRSERIFVISSDGELDEGSMWEAILFAGFHRLDNITLVIDYNKFQSFGRVKDVLDLEPLPDKFRAFNWEVDECDGHNFEDIERVFKKTYKSGKPTAIIAHTIKGKGVSFMEDKNEWHYRSPNEDDFTKALKELT